MCPDKKIGIDLQGLSEEIDGICERCSDGVPGYEEYREARMKVNDLEKEKSKIYDLEKKLRDVIVAYKNHIRD